MRYPVVWKGHLSLVLNVRTGRNVVARTSSRLYRGFLIRRGGAFGSTCSRLEAGDTAGLETCATRAAPDGTSLRVRTFLVTRRFEVKDFAKQIPCLWAWCNAHP